MNVYVVRYVPTGTVTAIFDDLEGASGFIKGRTDKFSVSMWRVLSRDDFTRNAT